MLIRTLTTVDQVIDALGGTFAVARLVGLGPSAVSNWLEAGRIAKTHYLIMTEALKAKSCTAPASLWGMSEGVTGARKLAAR